MISDKPLDLKIIPEKMHFIWLGGKLPEKYLTSIMGVARVAKKDGFSLSLWMDDSAIAHLEKTLINSDLTRKNLESIGIRIQNIDTLKPAMLKDDFYMKDKEYLSSAPTKNKVNFFWHCVDKERVGSHNFAAASDLLRLEILRQEGGYYFDTDTLFPSINLPPKPDKKLQEDDPQKYQRELLTYRYIANIHRKSYSLGSSNEKKLEIKSTPTIHGFMANVEWRYDNDVDGVKDVSIKTTCNDIIGSMPDHEIIQSALNSSLTNYQKWGAEELVGRQPTSHHGLFNMTKDDSKRLPHNIMKNSSINSSNQRLPEYNAFDRKNGTISCAGPGVLQQSLMDYYKKHSH
jgi:hypothetical protein